MGYLAAQDLGGISVKASSNSFVADVPSEEGVFNPSTNDSTVNLKAFQISSNMGKTIDSRPNVGGRITRIAQGASKPISFTLRARFFKKIEDRTAAQIVVEELDSVAFLMSWSKTKTIVMLFYMPNENDSTLLSNGQEVDFFNSHLKNLYDVLWDKNTSATTKGFGGSVYGTIHYPVELSAVIPNSEPSANFPNPIGTYAPCAIPVVFEDVVVDNRADTNFVDVEVTGFVLEDEGVN